MKVVLLVSILLLAACGSGRSGSAPAPVCRDVDGSEISCDGFNVLCVLFGNCQAT